MPDAASTPRQRLPNRRECHTETLAVDGQFFEATVGFDPESGQPRELFMSAGKEGSMLDALLADATVTISGFSAAQRPGGCARQERRTTPGCPDWTGRSGEFPVGPGACLTDRCRARSLAIAQQRRGRRDMKPAPQRPKKRPPGEGATGKDAEGYW